MDLEFITFAKTYTTLILSLKCVSAWRHVLVLKEKPSGQLAMGVAVTALALLRWRGCWLRSHGTQGLSEELRAVTSAGGMGSLWICPGEFRLS